jgi:hypothetical protein
MTGTNGANGVDTMFGGACSSFLGAKKPRRGLRRGNILRSQGAWEVASLKICRKFTKKSHVAASTYNFYDISAENGRNRLGNAPLRHAVMMAFLFISRLFVC